MESSLKSLAERGVFLEGVDTFVEVASWSEMGKEARLGWVNFASNVANLSVRFPGETPPIGEDFS